VKSRSPLDSARGDTLTCVRASWHLQLKHLFLHYVSVVFFETYCVLALGPVFDLKVDRLGVVAWAVVRSTDEAFHHPAIVIEDGDV